MLRVPPRGKRLRWLALVYGVAALLWLSREDNDVKAVAALGFGLAALLVIRAVTGQLGGKRIAARYVAAGSVVLGAMTGLGSAAAIAGLMLFKNALHAHVFLDYPPPVILGILERAPVWTVAGGLAGLGLALGWLGLRSVDEPQTPSPMSEERQSPFEMDIEP